MNNFEMPKIEIVKFACDSDVLTATTSFVIEEGLISNQSGKDFAGVMNDAGAFLDELM